MSLVSEFKEFAVKGNVMDLAVGVIIGAAFGKIVTSLVEDLIMPIMAAIFGGKLDFTNMLIPLGDVPAGAAMTYDALKKAAVPVFAYGNFITILINFLLMAVIVFTLVKAMNRMRKAEAAAPVEPTEEVVLLREISQKLSK